MNVAIEKPEILSLLFTQEKSDPDYGSCLWARFYLDLNNYTMAIESDCGNYTYGWVRTPKSESFLQLLARMDTDYLLGKISRETVIDGDATADALLEFIKECAEGECIDLNEEDLESIRDACYHHDNVRDLVDNVLDEVISTELRKSLEYDTDYIYGCVVMDYPASAKKIAEVFGNCIKPKIKEIIQGKLTMLSFAFSEPAEEE